jgi:hypothetical protein
MAKSCFLLLMTCVLLAAPVALVAQPTPLGQDLSSNRWDSLPADTLQVVVFYDGFTTGETILAIEVRDDDSDSDSDSDSDGNRPAKTPESKPASEWIVLHGFPKFDTQISSQEYALNGWVPTGRFVVDGVAPDGVIDGVAFGLFWKDSTGRYYLLKSNDDGDTFGADFVCGWPLGMSDAQLEERTPQITDPKARGMAKAIICGAKLLPDGAYSPGKADKFRDHSPVRVSPRSRR